MNKWYVSLFIILIWKKDEKLKDFVSHKSKHVHLHVQTSFTLMDDFFWLSWFLETDWAQASL